MHTSAIYQEKLNAHEIIHDTSAIFKIVLQDVSFIAGAMIPSITIVTIMSTSM